MALFTELEACYSTLDEIQASICTNDLFSTTLIKNPTGINVKIHVIFQRNDPEKLFHKSLVKSK